MTPPKTNGISRRRRRVGRLDSHSFLFVLVLVIINKLSKEQIIYHTLFIDLQRMIREKQSLFQIFFVPFSCGHLHHSIIKFFLLGAREKQLQFSIFFLSYCEKSVTFFVYLFETVNCYSKFHSLFLNFPPSFLPPFLQQKQNDEWRTSL
jgi:hypothetical protein